MIRIFNRKVNNMDGTYIVLTDHFELIKAEYFNKDDEKMMEVIGDKATIFKDNRGECAYIFRNGVIISEMIAQMVYAREENVNLKKVEDNRS